MFAAEKKPWAFQDDVLLIREKGKGKSEAELSILMGRTVESIKQRDIYLRQQREQSLANAASTTNWTRDEDAILTREKDKGTPIQEIARLLDRPMSSVQTRIINLKISQAVQSKKRLAQAQAEAEKPKKVYVIESDHE